MFCRKIQSQSKLWGKSTTKSDGGTTVVAADDDGDDAIPSRNELRIFVVFWFICRLVKAIEQITGK